MTGTIANAAAIILGTLAGVLIRSRLPQKSVEIVFQGIGLFTLAIGISMSLKSANLLLAVLSLVIGGLIGQALKLDRHLRQLTERLQRIAKKETAETQSSSRFTEGLITATMLFCVGSLSILGAIEEGSGETPRLLLTKSIMDGISSIALASSFGICILFSSVPLLIYQGGLTLFAGAMMRFMSGSMIAELTGGYDLFLPLMIVSVSSYLTIIAFEPHSIYSMRLAKKGQLLTHHKDKAVLTLMKMENVVEKDFVVVHPEMDLGELVKAIAASHRNVFPVTDKKTGELLGIVLLDDIRNIMFRQELYHRFTVNKLMTSAPAKIFDTDGMEQVMQTFDDTKAWNLPVVDEEGRYQGFVSKSKIFNSYRQVLVHFSED